MSFQSKSSSTHNESTYIRVPNQFCYCGRKFAIRSSDTTLNPQRLYYKCDPCNNLRWCKGRVEQENRGNIDEGESVENRGKSKMQEELKQMKKKLKQQQKVVNLVIQMGILMFVILLFVIMK